MTGLAAGDGPRGPGRPRKRVHDEIRRRAAIRDIPASCDCTWRYRGGRLCRFFRTAESPSCRWHASWRPAPAAVLAGASRG